MEVDVALGRSRFKEFSVLLRAAVSAISLNSSSLVLGGVVVVIEKSLRSRVAVICVVLSR